MGVAVLGSVVVEENGSLSPRERATLAALVVLRGQAVQPDQLADAVWGDCPPPTWAKQVQASVGLVRKALGAAAIETSPAGYRLTLDRGALDVERFEELVAGARTLVATGEPDRAASTFTRALVLWRGQPFSELPTWPPAVSEMARLEELRRSAEEDLLDARLACGEHREVAAAAEALVAAAPLRERRWAILALAQYRCGRQGDALRTLNQARRTLVEQLGIEPGRELAALEAAILNQDESLDVHVTAPVVAEGCPYKGLTAYDVDDHECFFGRDAQIAACLERLRMTPMLVVTGASGCGKSSLVRAGLAPALAHGHRRVVVVVPGTDPLRSLTEAIAADDGRPALIVDQFEELFAAGVPVEVIRSFCAEIADHASAESPVVIAIRADHLAALAADPRLGGCAERSLHFVRPLRGSELRAVIEEPARLAGLRVEQGLVDLLERDADGEPGALPLLSHALVETWRRRDGNVLTVEGYRASGGIRGAVARSADRLYDSLPAEQRALLRSLMLRLVAPSLEGDPVRCRVATATLRGDPARERIVDVLVRARLLTAEEDTVELAHEALARAWPRLRSWLDDDSAGQRLMRHLAAAAVGWEGLGRPDSELYRGARLQGAIEYRDRANPDVTAVELDFLEASRERSESEHAQLAARAARDARQNRRLRVLLTATACLLAVALATGVLALRATRDATGQRDAARVASDEATAQREAAQTARDDAELEALVSGSLALRSTARDVAALLAVEAARRWPDDARSRSALLGTFTAAKGFLGNHYLDGATHLSGTLVPDTSTAVIGLDGSQLAVYDLVSGRIDRRFPSPPPGALPDAVLRVSSDGRFVAELVAVEREPSCWDLAVLARDDGAGCAALSVYEIGTGRRVLGPVTPPFGPGDVAINADGSLVAAVGGFNGDLAVYRTADGSLTGRLEGVPRPDDAESPRDTAAVDFGADGRLWVGSLAGPIRALDPDTLDVVARVNGPPLSSHERLVVTGDLVVAAGAQWLVAAGTADGTVRWTADLRGIHPEPCPWLAASAGAGRVWCGNLYGIVEERYLDTGQPTGAILDPQLGGVGDLAVTSDGRELVSFAAQRPVISRWRLDGGGLVTDKVADGHVAGEYELNDGSTMIVARRHPTATVYGDFDDVALWDPATDREVDPLTDLSAGIGWVARDLVGSPGALYNVRTRSRVALPADAPRNVGQVIPSADGTRTYLVTTGGGVRAYDAHGQVGATMYFDDEARTVSATRDGKIVVVTIPGPDGSITTVHDGDTGDQLAGPLLGPWLTAVSLDGVLVGAEGGTITRYDLHTLEPLGELPGARGEINTLQFSRDGGILVATSLDQTVSVFDMASGIRLGDPIPSKAPFIYPAYLRPDGRAVAVTDRTGVAIWNLDPAALREAACKLAGRNLTTTEWATYLGHLGDYRPTCPEQP